MPLAGLDDTTPYFAIHPDFRQVATFALGWVFVTSLSSIVSSVLVQRFFGFIRGRPSASSDIERSLESEKLSIHSVETEHHVDVRHGYSNTAFFALPLCFLFASIAQFASLLAFPAGGDATCAFVVAWGGMAAQSGRLVGALIVIFELKRMGIARWEFWVAIVWLIVGIGFIFLNNAISVGVLTKFEPLNVSYCDRKHFLPASLISSILYFSLEVYAIARMMVFLSTGAPMSKVIRDIRVIRPVALVFLELATLVPSAVFTNTLAEFVPFSVGAVAVLLAFTVRLPPPVEVSPRHSTLSYATYPSVQSLRQSQSVGRSYQSRRQSTVQPPSPAVPAPARHHPYSASALAMDDRRDTWAPATARSTRTIDTTVAQSINDAVVQVGQRVHAPSRSVEVAPQQPPPAPPPKPTPTLRNLDSRIVPSQAEFAERLDLDFAQSNSLSARPRPTVGTPPANVDNRSPSDSSHDDVSELVSPASRMQNSRLRLSRFGDGPSRNQESRRTTFRTSYRTSLIPETVPSSPDSVVRATMPGQDSGSMSSSERRRSTSLSSADHHRLSNPNPNPTPERWPTFNQSQFRAAGFGTRSRASSVSSPPAGHRPPPLPLAPALPLPGAGFRQSQTPRGPRPPPLSASAQSPRFNLSYIDV